MTTKVTITHDEESHGQHIIVQQIQGDRIQQKAILSPGSSISMYVWSDTKILVEETNVYDELDY